MTKLKAQQDDQVRSGSGLQTPTGRDKLPSIREFHPTFHHDPARYTDVEMSDSDAVSPTFTAQPDETDVPSISPALPPQESLFRHDSYSSTSTDRRYYSLSTQVSPAFGPQPYMGYAHSEASAPPSASTSPALQPQCDVDQEAMAALLMLNNDRRGSRSSGGARGLSVRDLLSS